MFQKRQNYTNIVVDILFKRKLLYNCSLSFNYNSMVRRILLILSVSILGIYGGLQAQDAHFSQFYANPLHLNPAFTGSENCPRVALGYRNQWPALGPTYVTYSASYDQSTLFREAPVYTCSAMCRAMAPLKQTLLVVCMPTPFR